MVELSRQVIENVLVGVSVLGFIASIILLIYMLVKQKNTSDYHDMYESPDCNKDNTRHHPKGLSDSTCADYSSAYDQYEATKPLKTIGYILLGGSLGLFFGTVITSALLGPVKK